MIFLLACCKVLIISFISISSIREDKIDRSRTSKLTVVACVTTSSTIRLRTVLKLLSPPQKGKLDCSQESVEEWDKNSVHSKKCPIHQYPALTREFRGFSFSSRHWIALHGVCYLCFCTSHTLIPNQKKSVGTEKHAKHLKDPKGLSIRFLTILTIARLLPSPNSNRRYLCQRLGPIMDAGTLGPTNRPLSLRSRTWFIWRTQLFIFSCSSNKDF